jgi:hypothetical protein
MRSLHWLSLGLLAVAVAVLARYFLQHQETSALRAEIASLQQENSQLAELRAEHSRLLANRISDTELIRLRNDRAALTRLRAEINKLEEGADRKARVMQQLAARASPAAVVKIALSGNGGLRLNGAPADHAALRELFSGFAARAEAVDIRLEVNPGETPMNVLKETTDGILRLGKELGVRTSVRFDHP